MSNFFIKNTNEANCSYVLSAKFEVFSTKCVGWDDHAGWERVTSVGIGLIAGYSYMAIDAPQTYLQVKGFMSGNIFRGCYH